jgi:hypothetical protein
VDATDLHQVGSLPPWCASSRGDDTPECANTSEVSSTSVLDHANLHEVKTLVAERHNLSVGVGQLH